MNYGAKVASLLAISILISGFSSCNIKEPDVYICTILDGTEADCVNSINNEKTYALPVSKMVGFQCVAPVDYARIKSHHEILHKEISDK